MPNDEDYSEVITTNSYAYTSAQAAQAAAAAANAIANMQGNAAQRAAAAMVAAARNAAQQGASNDAVVAVARNAAAVAYAAANGGSSEGYNEPGVIQGVLNNWAGWANYVGGTVSNTADSAARGALSAAVPVGVGALLGSGTMLLIGGAILLVVVLAKR